MNKRISIIVISLAAVVAAILIAGFIVQADVQFLREESFTETVREPYTREESFTETIREPYTVTKQVPLTFQVVQVRNYRAGLFDVWDYQDITLRNADTAPGAYQISCRFTNQIGGVYRDTETVALVPGELKLVQCAVDTHTEDRIAFDYQIAPPSKSISEIQYRDVPQSRTRVVTDYRDVPRTRTRVVTDRCSVSIIQKMFGASC